MNVNTMGGALLASLLGMCIVFLVLVLIMFVIQLMASVFSRAVKAAPAAAPGQPPAPAAQGPEQLAPGSAGEIKLFDTPERTAAMIMAITAEKLGKPLNQLRFVSIKRIDGGNDK